MTSAEQNNTKKRTLCTLQTIRFVQICGAAVTAAATLAIIIADAIVWFRSPENWWSGFVYCFLVLQVMGIYAWGAICLIESAGQAVKPPKWLAPILVGIFVSGFFSWLPFQLILIHTETKSLPLIYSFLAMISFLSSLLLFGCANDTSFAIRKKLDPNFKIYRGFS